MNDKHLAVLVAVPLCSVCVLGPAVVGGLLASWFGWVGDLGVAEIVGLTVLGAIVMLGVTRYVQNRQQPTPTLNVDRQR